MQGLLGFGVGTARPAPVLLLTTLLHGGSCPAGGSAWLNVAEGKPISGSATVCGPFASEHTGKMSSGAGDDRCGVEL